MQELCQAYSIIESRRNSKKGNVLATEMRCEPTNMLRQSGTRDKSLVSNLPLPLTSASDLMAQPVFLFKMSHRGTVNTSISQSVLGNTLQVGNVVARPETGSTKDHFKCGLLPNILCIISTTELIRQSFWCLMSLQRAKRAESSLTLDGWRWRNLRPSFLFHYSASNQKWWEKYGVS